MLYSLLLRPSICQHHAYEGNDDKDGGGDDADRWEVKQDYDEDSREQHQKGTDKA